MPTSHRIQVWSNQDAIREYSWCLLDCPTTERTWQSVNLSLWEENAFQKSDLPATPDELHIYQVDHDQAQLELTASSLNSEAALQFLWDTLREASATGKRAVKLIIPLHSGYIVSSNIIPLRFCDSQHIQSAVSFAQPLQTYNGQSISDPRSADLTILFSAATAGLILYPDVVPESDAVESDLENRLSFPWIQPGTPQCKTLALVDANSAHPDDGLGFYRAAHELGIKVVVLENAGHWLEDPAQSHWREAFIPTRLTNPPEPDVGRHILSSLRAYGKPVDGIVTFADSFWYYIAQIAPKVGLQTAPPDSLRIATNKFLTSKYVGHEAYSANSLDEALALAVEVDLPYPLIVKPCDGWSSEGVSRVDTPDALPAAIKSIDTSRHGTEFVMEQYCSGPEVDVNLVLLDGKILFAEICDDLPKSADVNGPTIGSLTNFHELNSVYPSALPKQEPDLLITSFADTLLSLGIRNGVMHLEGRVKNSTMDYREAHGIIDLHAHNDTSLSNSLSAWLIEINPRPLGMTGSHIIESTYGIDYWALAAILGVNDKPRARALSIPYKNGPQYTAIMVFIPADFPVECDGIFDSDDICTDLIARRPDLGRSISRCATLVKRGEKLKHPSTGKNTFLAYFNVFSRVGRGEALRLAREVRQEVRYAFV
ncbi:unnamed protein product [Penicillium olsonii]|nr:unnamed protein product [Penicillium olsonii]